MVMYTSIMSEVTIDRLAEPEHTSVRRIKIGAIVGGVVAGVGFEVVALIHHIEPLLANIGFDVAGALAGVAGGIAIAALAEPNEGLYNGYPGSFH